MSTMNISKKELEKDLEIRKLNINILTPMLEYFTRENMSSYLKNQQLNPKDKVIIIKFRDKISVPLEVLANRFRSYKRDPTLQKYLETEIKEFEFLMEIYARVGAKGYVSKELFEQIIHTINTLIEHSRHTIRQIEVSIMTTDKSENKTKSDTNVA